MSEKNCMSDNFGGPNVVVCKPLLNWGEGWYCQKFNHNMNTAEILLYTNKNQETKILSIINSSYGSFLNEFKFKDNTKCILLLDQVVKKQDAKIDEPLIAYIRRILLDEKYNPWFEDQTLFKPKYALHFKTDSHECKISLFDVVDFVRYDIKKEFQEITLGANTISDKPFVLEKNFFIDQDGFLKRQDFIKPEIKEINHENNPVEYEVGQCFEYGDNIYKKIGEDTFICLNHRTYYESYTNELLNSEVYKNKVEDLKKIDDCPAYADLKFEAATYWFKGEKELVSTQYYLHNFTYTVYNNSEQEEETFEFKNNECTGFFTDPELRMSMRINSEDKSGSNEIIIWKKETNIIVVKTISLSKTSRIEIYEQIEEIRNMSVEEINDYYHLYKTAPAPSPPDTRKILNNNSVSDPNEHNTASKYTPPTPVQFISRYNESEWTTRYDPRDGPSIKVYYKRDQGEKNGEGKWRLLQDSKLIVTYPKFVMSFLIPFESNKNMPENKIVMYYYSEKTNEIIPQNIADYLNTNSSKYKIINIKFIPHHSKNGGKQKTRRRSKKSKRMRKQTIKRQQTIKRKHTVKPTRKPRNKKTRRYSVV